MPASPSISLAFHPRQQSDSEAITPQSPPDSGVEDHYKRPQLLEPQSPASPRASRSFFSGIRSGNKNKSKATDAAGLSAPSTPNISLNSPASYRLNVDPSSADLLQGSGVDTLSLSEGLLTSTRSNLCRANLKCLTYRKCPRGTSSGRYCIT